MKQNYAPTGKLARPVMLIQAVSDPVTLVEMSSDYASMAAAAGSAAQVRAEYVQRVGHCNFDRAETIAGLRAVEKRVAKGEWPDNAAAMNALAGSLNAGPSSFVDYKPAPFLRSCPGRQVCAGEQAGAKVSAPGHYSGYSDEAYPGYVLSSRYVAAADGTRLAVDLYRPATGGKATDDKLPVLLMHTTGVRRDPDPARHAARLAQYGIPALVRSGYVVAWMEPRGVGASFGASNGFVTPRMGQDVGAVVEWLAAQPWSTGKVGMIGSSNGGLIQMAAAATAPPHLVAIAPGVANPNFYYQLYPNGASAVAGAGSPAGPTARAPAPGTPVDEDDAPGHPLLAAATAEHKGGIGMAVEWPANMSRDTPNPAVGYAPGLAAAPIEASARIAATGIPIYQMAGWFDSSPGGQLAAWKAWGGKVVVGSWLHSLLQPTEGGAMLNIEYRRWYDRLLKGVDNGILDEPPVYYQTIQAAAGDDWRFAADWPLAAQRVTPFYFAPGGKLASGKAPARATQDRYQVDYDIAAFDGKFNRLERTWNGDMAAGVDAKGISYTTAALMEDQEITGHPVAHLWVSSSAPDGNFILYLEEVEAGGNSRFVTDGVMRAGHRATTEQSPWRELGVPYHRSMADGFAPLPQDRPVELAFDFNPTSYVFRKGSRIRITVTGAERNTYQLPPGAEGKPAPVVSLYLGGAHASHVTLPLIPARSARFKGQAQVASVAFSYKGVAEFYPSAGRNYLKLGERWIRCDAIKASRECTSAIGRLKVEQAGTRVRVSGKGIRFDGTGF
jgi:putative CocE/NonD family hydrolase